MKTIKCLFFDAILSSASILTSVLDAKWILHIDAMWLECIQASIYTLFVDVSWVHDFHNAQPEDVHTSLGKQIFFR